MHHWKLSLALVTSVGTAAVAQAQVADDPYLWLEQVSSPRAMVTTMPDWIMAMPGAAQRIAAATAHLPKPPKAKPTAKAK